MFSETLKYRAKYSVYQCTYLFFIESLKMFSSTKLENRPHSTLREQRLFYNRLQISIILVKQMFCQIQHSTAIF